MMKHLFTFLFILSGCLAFGQKGFRGKYFYATACSSIKNVWDSQRK